MKVMVQISQTPALIGMETTLGNLTISQPPADLQITTTPGEWNIHQPAPEVTIDQSRARAAYTGGTYREMSQRIYSGVEQLWLQGIAKRMEQGERMANFHKPGNSIGEVYGEDWHPVSYPEVRGPASYDNVDIDIKASPVQIEYRRAEVHIQVEQHKPQFQYTPSSVDIYLRQKPSLTFTPQVLDEQV
ncbi:DUF6470 family protein [Paenibacillus sabinae]|uniref:Uncharacterized protein n=1 Tax=Paenibacillus sabinae T27 TaxID=1268072 RepID=X4ZSD4_9BACL|nr:DUF6470 family protein [Paenibacillus sabinae]AHV99350.1 hypothetical protein PSAB_22315 [Paenibacillus sabinae T27]